MAKVKLRSYLKPYWKVTVLAPLAMVLEVAMDLLQPALMSRIVDQGIFSHNYQLVLETGLLMIAVAGIGMLGGFGCTIFSSIASQNFGADLRTDLFTRIQAFSFHNLDRFPTASLITRLTNDVVQVQNVVLIMLRSLVRAPLLCIGGIIMALTIDPQMASVLLIAIPLLGTILGMIITKGFPLFGAVQRRLDRVNTVIRENLAGVRVVKAFVRADYEQQRFAKANADLTVIAVKAGRMVGLTMPVMVLVMNFSLIAVVWFGGIKVNQGGIAVGQIMALINYMTQILFALMMVGFMLMMVSRAKASAERIQEVLAVGVDITDPAVPVPDAIKQGRIRFENVSFRYPGASGAPVLRQISFEALPGETVAILGATGSGKSTLVNLLPRFYDVTEGRILIDGTDVRAITLDELRQKIGAVPQESILFSGTVIENIRWGRTDASEAAVVAAAQAAQADEFIRQLSDGYQTNLSQRGVNLSGGQKQRLSIARALVRQPLILIFDDSTSAVDLGTEARIRRALKNMPRTTCLVVAQRISSVMAADKIIVLEDGAIAAIGTHRQLLQESAVYQDIYRSQMGVEEVV